MGTYPLEMVVGRLFGGIMYFMHMSFRNARHSDLAQKFLGHANVSTTADIYTHASEAAEREAAAALEKSIFGNLFPTVPNLGTGNSFSVN